MKMGLSVLKKPRHFLAFFGLRVAHQLRLSHVPILPTGIDIEPNNWCNFRCDHCQVTHWDKPKAQLDVASFSKIISQFPNLLDVKVQGMGEPFLNKSTIDMLEYLDARDIASNTISNGSVLSAKLIARLSKLKRTSIGFSLDGGTKQTFEGIRIRGNFEKVTDNVKSLVSKAANLDTRFWVVVSNENYKECEDIVRLADWANVPHVIFQTYMTSWGKDDMKEKISEKSVNQSDIQDHLDKAIKIGKDKNINVHNSRGNSFTAKQPCKWPWRSMMIDSSGNVIPCSILADSETLSFGNIFEQKVTKIWNSTEYKGFRKAHAQGNIPEACKACYR